MSFLKSVREGDGNTVKNDGGDQMVVIFTITEINILMVSLFRDSVPPLPYLQYICGVKFFGCTIIFVSGIATKSAMAIPNLFTIF